MLTPKKLRKMLIFSSRGKRGESNVGDKEKENLRGMKMRGDGESEDMRYRESCFSFS